VCRSQKVGSRLVGWGWVVSKFHQSSRSKKNLLESVLDLSLHVEIDLSRFRPGFRPARLMEFGLRLIAETGSTHVVPLSIAILLVGLLTVIAESTVKAL